MCIFGYLILFLFYKFSLRATSYSVEVLSIIITLHSCFALQTEKDKIVAFWVEVEVYVEKAKK